MSLPQSAAELRQARQDAGLAQLVASVPYLEFLGMGLRRQGNALTGSLPGSPQLIGNPAIPALHGGVTVAFLENTAALTLAWHRWVDADMPTPLPVVPRCINTTVDFLRPGQQAEAFARARIIRAGRRYASVQVEAWQDRRERLFAQANCHFLMSPEDD